MTKSLSKTVRQEIADSLEDMIKSLRRAADSLSEDPRELAEKTVEEVFNNAPSPLP
jgi:DNA-binding MurR/RpiR family transcriptional regulator